MDERWIGALSGAGVILGLAIVQALPHRHAVRAQEAAKWFIAALLLAAGPIMWLEGADRDGILIMSAVSVLIVTAWRVRRWRARQRPPRPERLPPGQR